MKSNLDLLYPQLRAAVTEARSGFELIAPRRKVILERLAAFISGRVEANETANLVFICTHNSRRSQFAQVWARTAALVFDIPRVETHSGGTEATAFEPRAVAALARAGFRIDSEGKGDNPVYRVRLSDSAPAIPCYSKIFTDAPNPTSGFCAVMTCSAADRGCPVVLGAASRLTLAYEDPKAFDTTEREAAAYDERCRQIACELLWAFSVAR